MNREVLFSREDSWFFRGISMLLVVASHFAGWWITAAGENRILYAGTRMGVYGVASFFLLSAYGLAKSAGEKKVGASFFWRRVKSVYLPYLIFAFLIELYTGGVWNLERIVHVLSGKEYWFITNILLFYLAFFLIWRFVGENFRIWVLGAVIILYSVWLFYDGRQSFWYLSNLAFWLGVLAARYEKQICRWFRKGYPLQVAAWVVLLIGIAAWGIHAKYVPVGFPMELYSRAAAASLWAVSLMWFAPLRPKKEKLMIFIGKHSLTIYLLHTFFYYRLTEWLDVDYRIRFLLSLPLMFILAPALDILVQKGIQKAESFLKRK